MSKGLCPERQELEKRLHESVEMLRANSVDGISLAKSESDIARFKALQRNHDLLFERVKALRECLELHKDVHQC
jgi:hypothetical protein